LQIFNLIKKVIINSQVTAYNKASGLGFDKNGLIGIGFGLKSNL
jgi:hypothetical protein